MTNEYAFIEVDLQNDTLAELGGPARPEAIDRVLASPARYAPPVLMALGPMLVGGGRGELGAFWFYAGQLRARFDARRCTDPTAGAACDALTHALGPPVNRYAFARPGLLPGLIDRVVEWDAATPHHYDHRWIALHGLGPSGSSTPTAGYGRSCSSRARRRRPPSSVPTMDGDP